jgi:hypothetical protein
VQESLSSENLPLSRSKSPGKDIANCRVQENARKIQCKQSNGTLNFSDRSASVFGILDATRSPGDYGLHMLRSGNWIDPVEEDDPYWGFLSCVRKHGKAKSL